MWNTSRNISFVVGSHPLEAADRNRFFFHAASTAGWFAGTITCPAKYAREYIRFPIDHISVVISAQCYHPDVLRNRRVRRTGILAIDYFMKIFGISKICRFQVQNS